MSEWNDNVEPLTLKGQIKVPYNWSVGEVGSRFWCPFGTIKKLSETAAANVGPFMCLPV